MSPVRELSINGRQGYEYETVETFRLGRMPLYQNRIRVQTILTEPDRQIDSIVHSVPNIRLDVRYLFESVNGGTSLNERMTISVAAWLSRFVIDQAKQAQTQTLANLKQRLEADTHNP